MLRTALPLVLALGAAGCAVGPRFSPPAAPNGAGYAPAGAAATAGGQPQHFVEGGEVASDWWRLFRSPELDAMVSEGRAHNASLAAAEAALHRSQDSMKAGYGVFFPQVGGTAGASRQLFSPYQIGSSAPGSTFNLFTLSGKVSYALDVWGGARRALEALQAQVDAQTYTTAAAYIMLESNIASAFIALSGYRAQVVAVGETILLEQEQVRIADVQARSGTAPYANVATAQSQLAATEALLPPLQEKIDQAEDLLAALCGRTPAEWKDQPIGLESLTLPDDLPVSLPSKIVRQRPDVLTAEAMLHVSSAQIGVAIAAELPSFSLSGSLGTNSTNASNLFGPGTVFWSLGAGVAAPIFDGGTLWYQRKAAIDAYDQARAQYRETVLSAFEQVADTMRGLDHDAEAVAAEGEAVRASEEAVHLLQANFQSGVATYLQILVADGLYLQAKTSYVQAVTQRLEDTVALYASLGGGWWREQKEQRGPSVERVSADVASDRDSARIHAAASPMGSSK